MTNYQKYCGKMAAWHLGLTLVLIGLLIVLNSCGSDGGGSTYVAPPPLPETPEISLNTEALTNQTVEGVTAPTQTFEVWNSGPGVLNYQITTDADWLQCVPDQGDSVGEHDIIEVVYSGSELLTPGEHTGSIFVGAPGIDSESIMVTLTVEEAPPPPPPVPEIFLNLTLLNNSIIEAETAPTQTFEIWNANSETTLDYEITDEVDWLECDPPTGQSTGEHDTIEVLYIGSDLLDPGEYTATITITAVDAINSPRYITVNLTVFEHELYEFTDGTWAFSNECFIGDPGFQFQFPADLEVITYPDGLPPDMEKKLTHDYPCAVTELLGDTLPTYLPPSYEIKGPHWGAPHSDQRVWLVPIWHPNLSNQEEWFLGVAKYTVFGNGSYYFFIAPHFFNFEWPRSPIEIFGSGDRLYMTRGTTVCPYVTPADMGTLTVRQ